MNGVCGGLTDEALALFKDTKLFGGLPPVVDTPYRRFEGVDEIREFAEGFLDRSCIYYIKIGRSTFVYAVIADSQYLSAVERRHIE